MDNTKIKTLSRSWVKLLVVSSKPTSEICIYEPLLSNSVLSIYLDNTEANLSQKVPCLAKQKFKYYHIWAMNSSLKNNGHGQYFFKRLNHVQNHY